MFFQFLTAKINKREPLSHSILLLPKQGGCFNPWSSWSNSHGGWVFESTRPTSIFSGSFHEVGLGRSQTTLEWWLNWEGEVLDVRVTCLRYVDISLHDKYVYIIDIYIYTYTCMTLLKMFCAPFDRDETALFNNRRSQYQNRLFAIRCRLCIIHLFGTLFFCALTTHKRTSAGFVSFFRFFF